MATIVRHRPGPGRSSPARPGRSVGRWAAGAAVVALSVAIGAAAAAPAGASTVSKRARAQDVRLAAKMILTPSAFPGIGWSESNRQVSNGAWPTGAAGAAFAACVGIPQSLLTVDPPDALSPVYQESVSGISVDEEVQVFATAQAAAADIGVSANPKTPGCEHQLLTSSYGATFTQGLAQAVGTGSAVGTVTVTALPKPPGGQESAAYRITVPIIDGAQQVTFSIDNVTIGRGRLEAGLSLLSTTGTFPAKLAAHLEAVAAATLPGLNREPSMGADRSLDPLDLLDEVRVVDLTSTLSGPYGTLVLGDLGAEVVKVEPPSGDPMRDVGPRRHDDMAALFLNINRNKRSVVLDLSTDGGRSDLVELCRSADVAVHNLRPGTAGAAEPTPTRCARAIPP